MGKIHQKLGVTGIMIRGPHHVRSETDKINVVTLEFLSDDGVEFVMKYSKNGSIMSTTKGFMYAKQNAVERGSFSYLANCTNILLPVVNLIGERLFKTLNEGHDPNLAEEITKNTVEKYCTFYNWKISESIFWAINARSQEEGGMAVIRKIGMQIISRTLGGKNMKFLQPKELAEKLNECVIDSPLIS